jgi:hypothetical protein
LSERSAGCDLEKAPPRQNRPLRSTLEDEGLARRDRLAPHRASGLRRRRAEDSSVEPGTDADDGSRETSSDALTDGQPDADNDTAPAAPGSPPRALAVTTWRLHTCALPDNHRIKCRGYNDFGALGLGDTRNRGSIATDMGDNLPFVDLGGGQDPNLGSSVEVVTTNGTRAYGVWREIDPRHAPLSVHARDAPTRSWHTSR